MKAVKSCGVMVFRREPEMQFLLLRLPRWVDLPKGHIEAGETELECALRELREETGIEEIDLVDGFRFPAIYYPKYNRNGGETVEKTVVYFLGFVEGDPPITLTEHVGYEWAKWPPGSLGFAALDELIAAVKAHFEADAGNT